MPSKSGKLALSLLCVSLACAVPQLLARKKDKPPDSSTTEQKRAVQALNRLTFGPRPGDVQQVMAMGVGRWIDLQLHPEKIPDTAIDARLADFRTLHLSSKEIAEEFPDNQMVKQVMDGKRPVPSDPAKRAVFQVQIARLEERQEKKQRKNEDRKGETVVPVSAPPVSDSAKTAEELAAAAAASGDATPSASADSNSTNSMSTNSTSVDSTSMDSIRAVPRPTVVDDPTQARRREDRLYADLKFQGLIDLPTRSALQESAGHVGRRANRLGRFAARRQRQSAGFSRRHEPKAKGNAARDEQPASRSSG